MEKRHGGMGVGEYGSQEVWSLSSCRGVDIKGPASGEAGQQLTLKAVSGDTHQGEVLFLLIGRQDWIQSSC